jgi:pyruvate formate-lyase activating enzyme-like uncharacterized protein
MPKWVLSNDLQISWVGDHCRIFNQRRPDLSIMSTDWSICLLLDLFKYPSDPESVLESCHSISTEKARDFIRELAAIEVLVPESCIPKHAPDGAGQAQQYEQSLHTRRQRLQFLKYDDLGLTITNCGKNELSRGCQACKSGSWVCIFVGLHCNASCPFCPQPVAARSMDETAFGTEWIDRLEAGLEANKTKVKAISLSGGEPFLYEDSIRRIVSFVRRCLPDVYQWVDTNGRLVTADKLKCLTELGLAEIRFNLAASHFDHDLMHVIVRQAVDIVSWVAVEVPVYEETYHHLFEKETLVALDDLGVRQLNLGQLFAGACTSSAATNFADLFCSAAEGTIMTERRARHRDYTYDIFELAYRKGLKIRINDCSDKAKNAQALSRENLGGPEMFGLLDLVYPRPATPQDLLAPPQDAISLQLGSAYRVLTAGTGSRRPIESDFVVIRYIGWSADGQIVDSSYRRGLEGVPFRLSALNPALSEALRMMVVGDKRRVWIAGSRGRVDGECAPMLVVDVELVGIKPAELPC